MLPAGPWIEVAAGRGEVRFTLADRVQVHAVEPRLEAARRHGNVDDGASSLLALDELDLAGDPVTLDIRLRARAALRDRHRAGKRHRRTCQHHSSIRHMTAS